MMTAEHAGTECGPAPRPSTVERAARRKRIGLLGTFGGGNLGDAATQDAVIAQIRKRCPDAEILGFSMVPEDTERRHGIRSFAIYRNADLDAALSRAPGGSLLDRLAGAPGLGAVGRLLRKGRAELELLRRARRDLRGLDHLIISGGGQLDDYWGGAWHHPYTLFKYARIARWSGARVGFVSVGAGPIDSALGKLFIRGALSQAHLRSFRDQESRDLIRSIGFRGGEAQVCPDLAFSLPLPQSSARRPAERVEVVGIGPMPYCDPRVWPQKDEAAYRDYLGKLAEFSCRLLQQGYRIMLFSGQVSHDPPAMRDLRALIEQSGAVGARDRVIEAPVLTVDELLTQLAKTDLVVASRFHGVLLSKLMGKPVLAVSYHDKIDALMADTGQSRYCLPIDRFDAEMLHERFTALEADRAAVAEEVGRKVAEYRSALEEQYDRVLG